MRVQHKGVGLHYIRGKYEIVANNIRSVLIVLLSKKNVFARMHLKHYYGHYISRGVLPKKIPLFLLVSSYEKERSHYSSKKDEDMMEYIRLLLMI